MNEVLEKLNMYQQSKPCCRQWLLSQRTLMKVVGDHEELCAGLPPEEGSKFPQAISYALPAGAERLHSYTPAEWMWMKAKGTSNMFHRNVLEFLDQSRGLRVRTAMKSDACLEILGFYNPRMEGGSYVVTGNAKVHDAEVSFEVPVPMPQGLYFIEGRHYMPLLTEAQAWNGLMSKRVERGVFSVEAIFQGKAINGDLHGTVKYLRLMMQRELQTYKITVCLEHEATEDSDTDMEAPLGSGTRMPLGVLFAGLWDSENFEAYENSMKMLVDAAMDLDKSDNPVSTIVKANTLDKKGWEKATSDLKRNGNDVKMKTMFPNFNTWKSLPCVLQMKAVNKPFLVLLMIYHGMQDAQRERQGAKSHLTTIIGDSGDMRFNRVVAKSPGRVLQSIMLSGLQAAFQKAVAQAEKSEKALDLQRILDNQYLFKFIKTALLTDDVNYIDSYRQIYVSNQQVTRAPCDAFCIRRNLPRNLTDPKLRAFSVMDSPFYDRSQTGGPKCPGNKRYFRQDACISEPVPMEYVEKLLTILQERAFGISCGEFSFRGRLFIEGIPTAFKATTHPHSALEEIFRAKQKAAASDVLATHSSWSKYFDIVAFVCPSTLAIHIRTGGGFAASARLAKPGSSTGQSESWRHMLLSGEALKKKNPKRKNEETKPRRGCCTLRTCPFGFCVLRLLKLSSQACPSCSWKTQKMTSGMGGASAWGRASLRV